MDASRSIANVLEGIHEKTNNNGSRRADFAVSRQIFIGSTKFEHRDIHKITWKRADGSARNQIDHILIDKHYITDLLDVRSYRRANIESDHCLIGTKLRARITVAKCQWMAKAKCYKIERLKTVEVRETYAMTQWERQCFKMFF